MHYYQINISGDVFKTGYRYFLKEVASRLNIHGFVKYLPDHSVVAITGGTEEHLKEFVELCRTGNKDSIIHTVSVKEIAPVDYPSFEVVDNE